MKFSKYTHAFSLGNDIALYNSLRLKPVYLPKDKYFLIKNYLSNDSENISDEIKNEINELGKYKIIINNDETDSKILNL